MTHARNIVKMLSVDGVCIDAMVGDEVIAYDITSKKITVQVIHSVKKKFILKNMKHTPKASNCMWLRRPKYYQNRE